MAVNSDLVYVGSPDRVTGSVMRAPKGTPLPTDASTAPNAAFVDSGYITEDGCTLADAQTWVDIKDWGGDIVRRIKSESIVTIAASFLEVNANSAKAAFGDSNVSTTGGQIAIKINAKEPGRASWLFNMLDGDRYIRLVVSDGQVTDRADMQFTRQGAVVIPVTITAYPDINGDTVIIYAEAPTPDKASASPGDVFPTEPTVTASDATNAAKLGPLGYVASPTTAWTTGQKITVNGFDFHWSGTAWTAAAAP
jgi:hypothetical protein